MSVMSHLATLRLKHEELDRKIQNEVRSPGSDDLDITAMKRQKLQIKEEINRLSGSP